MYDLRELEELAQKTLSAKRFFHTSCVAKRAQLLAKIHGCDCEKAMAAGWLHDICKEQKPQEQLQWLTKYGIILDGVQQEQPKTWHGMAACGYMKFALGIDDPQILHAVRYHTTACKQMSSLDEVVYLADLTSDERDYPDIAYMRRLSETALKPAMKYAMQYAIQDLVQRAQQISVDSFQAYNYYTQF